MTTPLRTLIVENSEADLLLLLRELRRGGYEPSYACVGDAAALAAELGRGPWDLILCAYQLPGFGGAAALALCHERDLDLPFIVVSGAVGEAVAVELLRAGAHDVIRKDNLSRLIPAIARELQDAGTRRARRQAEQALRESEEKYRTLVQAAPDAIVALDREGRVTSFNPASTRLWGLAPGAVIGRTLAEAGIVAAPAAPGFAQELAQTLAGEVRPPYALVTRHRDGPEVLVEANALPVRHGPAVVGAQLTLRDITEHRRLEAQLRLAQKLEAIGQLASGVAHDFNNQLCGILGCAEILQHEVAGNPDLRWLVDTLVSGANRAAGLTSQLLAFTRKGTAQTAPVSLHQVIGEVVQLLEHTLDRRIAIRQELRASPDTVAGDASLLQNAVLNLAVNARDAMPAGGVLTFATELAQVNAETGRAATPTLAPGAYLTVAVRDTGHGIEPELLPLIFEPFFTTKPPGQGTGLGLAAVYNTLRSHHGAVAVRSAPGQGATFTLYLPVKADREAAGAGPDAPRWTLGTGRILVIDDEPIVRAIAERMLTSLGYTVVVHGDAEAALAWYRAQPAAVELVLLDLVMPKLNGIEAFHALRQINPAARVLLTSGHAPAEDLHALLGEGAVGFMQKPFRMNELSRQVAAAMKESKP